MRRGFNAPHPARVEDITIAKGVLARLREDNPELYSQVHSRCSVPPSIRSLTEHLAQETATEDASIRLSAVSSLLSLAEQAPPWWIRAGSCHEEIRLAVDALADSLDADITDTRLRAVQALGLFSPACPGSVVYALNRALQDPVTAVIMEAINSLNKCGNPTYFAASLEGLGAALANEDDKVFLASAATLQRIGRGAASDRILSQLVDRTMNAQDLTIRREALRALVSIDVDATHTAHTLSDSTKCEEFLSIAAQLGPESLHWRERLISFRSTTNAPPGYQRLLFQEIVRYIFGGDEREASYDRRVNEWINGHKLRAIKVARGAYNVSMEELDVLRRIYHSD